MELYLRTHAAPGRLQPADEWERMRDPTTSRSRAATRGEDLRPPGAEASRAGHHARHEGVHGARSARASSRSCARGPSATTRPPSTRSTIARPTTTDAERVDARAAPIGARGRTAPSTNGVRLDPEARNLRHTHVDAVRRRAHVARAADAGRPRAAQRLGGGVRGGPRGLARGEPAGAVAAGDRADRVAASFVAILMYREPSALAMTSFRRSRSGPRNRFPLATLMATVPTKTFATKLVVSVIGRPGQRDPSAMRTWTTHAIDVRSDPAVAAEVAGFVQQHGAKQTVSTDRIIGCPHEEGIDYPLGRTCPRCPFWADIDRFTHEPVTPPVPTLAPAEILEDLSFRRSRVSCTKRWSRPTVIGPRSSSRCFARSIAASPILRVRRRKRRRSFVTRCTCWRSGERLVPIHTWCDGCRCRVKHLSKSPGMSSRRMAGGFWLPCVMETSSRSGVGRRSERERVRPWRRGDRARSPGRVGRGAARVHPRCSSLVGAGGARA